MNNNIPKKALCIRNTSTWGHIKPEHKFDSEKFNPESFLRDLPIMSPKINYMLDKIILFLNKIQYSVYFLFVLF